MKEILIFLLLYFMSFSQYSAIIAKNSIHKPTKTEIKNILLANQKKWGTGERIQLVYSKDVDIVRGIYQFLFGSRFVAAIRKLRSNIFTGKIRPPKEYDSDIEIMNRVYEYKNAIGLVKSSSINKAFKRKVRVILNTNTD